MGLIAGGRSPGRSRRFFARCLSVAGAAINGYGGASEKIPRVSASASLMRAPVFQSVPAASCDADRAHPFQWSRALISGASRYFGSSSRNKGHLAQGEGRG